VITLNQISNDQTICSGTAPTALTGQQPKGGNGTYTYLWEMSAENQNQVAFNPAPGINNQADYTPPVLTQNSIFRRIVFSDPCQQSTSNSVRIQVNPIPPLPVAADAITCNGSPVVLTASGPAGNFAWYAAATGGEPLATGKTFETPAIQQETTFYVESLAGGCSSARVPVKVALYSTAAQASADVTISKGQQTLLQASGGVSYTWYPATGLSASNIQNPWAKPTETTTYLVTVKTAEGCISTDEVTVTVIPRIIVTNGITPNGDGANDTWVIKNIEFYPQAQIDIFNRWGNKVFSSKGYGIPWDGTYNGQPLPVAAYYYVIKLNNEEPPISGSITLVK
jgi:gliding motility-associated-like protein